MSSTRAPFAASPRPSRWPSLLIPYLCAAGLAVGCGPKQPKERPKKERPSPADHKHTTAGETCFICEASKRDPKRLWCKEHSRYEDRCWLCHPELRDPKRLYCEEHGVYEDECPICRPDKPSESRATPAATESAASRPWCQEHERYEDRCWKCHPELRDGARPYCDEHGAYEDECKQCSPASGDANPGPKKTALFCNEHQVPEHDCGICQPQRSDVLRVGESLLVRLPSARSADMAGIALARPIKGDADTSLQLLGRVRFNGNRVAEVSSLSPGVVSETGAVVGAKVKPGQSLAVVNAPAVARARVAYFSARADERMKWKAAKRERLLLRDKITAARNVERAVAEHHRARAATKAARQELLNLGFAKADIGVSLEKAGSRLPLRTPFGGTVVKRVAVVGQAVERGTVLFTVADLKDMWVELSVPQTEAARLTVDTPIWVTVMGNNSDPVRGRISWVAPIVDPRTRMVRARGVVPNPTGSLRDGMFAKVRAVVDRHPDALRLPAAGLHQIGGKPFVFVRSKPDLFAAKRVEVGDRLLSDEVVIHGGLGQADQVVIAGGFAIKSALLASRLGAGCTDD